MTGGGEEVKTNGSEETIIKKINPVPGSSLNNINNEKRISEAKSELSELSNAPLRNIFKLFSLDIVKKRFEENPKWSGNLKSYLFLLLLFFIIGSILDLTFISKSNMKGINFLVSLLIVIVSYVPIIFSFATIGSFIANDKIIKIIILILSGISLILSIFGMPFIKSSAKENWVFWIVIVCFISNIFLIIIGKLMSKAQLMGSSNESSDGTNNSAQPSAPELQEEYLILKAQLEQERMKRMLYEEELERLSSNNKGIIPAKVSINNIKELQKQLSSLTTNLTAIKDESSKKNENIENLKSSIVNLLHILKDYKLNITKEYLTTIINILENKFDIESLKDEKNRKQAILNLLNNITNNITNNNIKNNDLKNELYKLKVAKKPIYNEIINSFKNFKTYIENYPE
jgi:hypothetical protein